MNEFVEKHVLITGASGGIGSAIARHFHSRGATVGLSGTKTSVLEKLADDLGSRTNVFVADLSDPNAPAGLLNAVEKSWPSIDILINNAGITRDGLALRMKDDDWDLVFRINLQAAFQLIRGVLRGMIRRRSGQIVNVTSVVALTGNPGQSSYTAAKAGMIAMTKSIAREVAVRGIRANCVAPGLIESPMTENLPDAQRQTMLGSIPLVRMGNAAEVAEAVGFLASDASSYITGETLHVNGGMLMT